MTLSIEELKLSTGDKPILDVSSIHLPERGILLLSGPSGAGKSLFIKSILGLVKADKDHSKVAIRFNDKAIDESRSHLSKIGYIPQDIRRSFDQNKTIHYHIKEALLGRHLSESDLHNQLIDFHLPVSILLTYPHQCSGGQLQRLLVLIANLHQPDLIIADEAISALDDDNETAILQYFKKQTNERDCLIICVSHRYNLSFYDHVIFIDNGKVLINKNVVALSDEDRQQLIPSSPIMHSMKQGGETSPIIMRLVDACLPYNLLGHKRLNLTFCQGQSYGIFGKSGIGKTTLLNCISGLVKFESGEKIFTDLLKGRPHVQIVFQHPATSVNPKHTMLEYLNEYNHIYKKKYPISHKTLMSAMELDEGLLSRTTSQLSGGELQRMTIIRALASNPSIILFDEAFASIDHAAATIIKSALVKHQNEFNTTYVFVSHDKEFLRSTSHEVIEL